jgi:hypothetical protein
MAQIEIEACVGCADGDHAKHSERNVVQNGAYIGDVIHCLCERLNEHRPTADGIAVPRLLTAVQRMADCLDGIDIGDVFAGFSCTELDSIALVLAEAGHLSTARWVLLRHAEDDEEDDLHKDIHDALTSDGSPGDAARALTRDYVDQLLRLNA